MAGILVLVVLVAVVLSQIPSVPIPVLLKLFPATLLTPGHGVPAASRGALGAGGDGQHPRCDRAVVGTLAIIATLVVAQLRERDAFASEGLE